MNKTIPGDHAFPKSHETFQVGLNKREYFACAIMAGLSVRMSRRNESPESNAECAVKLADALIEALNKKE